MKAKTFSLGCDVVHGFFCFSAPIVSPFSFAVEAKRKRPRKMESQEGWGGEATGSNDTRKQGEQGTKNSGEGARGGYERTEVQQGRRGVFRGRDEKKGETGERL